MKQALEKFIEEVLADEEFKTSIEAFLQFLAAPARITSLSQTLLKFTAPGIPDTYQGTELWDLSLVDPDNRRPVDYQSRRRLLAELDRLTPEQIPEQIMERGDEGLSKLWTIRQALRVRNARPDSFGAEGSYRALWPSGPKAAHVIAFQRGRDVITVVPRLSISLDTWDTTFLEIPEGSWSNQLTGETVEGGKVEVGALLTRFPVALLTLLT